MEERWSFLSPWCVDLSLDLRYYLSRGDGLWDAPTHELAVLMPNLTGGIAAIRIHEAMLLLGAVAHVDHAAWKFLLSRYCQVDFGVEGEEPFEEQVPVRFKLSMPYDNPTYVRNFVWLFGVSQRNCPSAAYLRALHKIAELDETLHVNGPGVDVEVPVRINFFASGWPNRGPYRELLDIQQGTELAREEWNALALSAANQPVEPGSLRCTLVLEPLTADFEDWEIDPDMARTMEQLVMNNVWFSKISLWVTRDFDTIHDGFAEKRVFGQLLARIFDSTRRCYELSDTRYFEAIGSSTPLQLGTIDVFYQSVDCAAMCSALAFNQTTENIILKWFIMSRAAVHNAYRWRWLAYGVFSKRAKAGSALKRLSLGLIASMTAVEMEAFSSIVTSDHPEEELFGLQHGSVDEREAMIVGSCPIRWGLSEIAQLDARSRVMSFSRPIPFVWAFNDDGESDWVHVLIPGYGKCQVQRKSLVFHAPRTDGTSSASLSSLEISFDNTQAQAATDGLPRFLSAVGRDLECLTIEGAAEQLDIGVILQHCPKLQELSLTTRRSFELQLSFSEYRKNNTRLPALRCSVHDVPTLLNELSDRSNLLNEFVRRLRVHLDRGWISFRGGQAEGIHRVLRLNVNLEYVEVVVPSTDERHVTELRSFHRKPIARVLEPVTMENKVAFLSVLAHRRMQLQLTKKRKCQSSNVSGSVVELDQDVLSLIFAFAAVPMRRNVFFRCARF